MDGKISSDTKFRVRYADTDKMGIVYYANYLTFMEVGRTEIIRQVWRPYAEFEAEGYVLPVLSAEVKYIGSARYDDLLTVRTHLKEFTKVKLYFEYEIFLEDGTKIAVGNTRHCWADEDGNPRRLSNELWEDFIKVNDGKTITG